MRNRLIVGIVGATLAWLGACSGSSQQVERAAATSSASASLAAPVGAPGPPKLVLQGVNLPALSPGKWDPWEGMVANDDGTLVASFGPDLVLVDGADGSIRARFPHCAIGAEFHADELIVIGCPPKPVDPDKESLLSPDTTVYRWDLERDAITVLTTGPYAFVSLTTDGSRALLRGRQKAVVIELASGEIRATFTVDGAASEEIQQLSSSGERALVHTRTEDFVLSANGKRSPIAERRSLTPDLGHAYELDYKTRRLLVANIDGSGRVETEIPEATSLLGFDRNGERAALWTRKDEREAIQLLDSARRPLCKYELPPKHRLERGLTWAADSEMLAFTARRGDAAGDEPDETTITLRARDCTVAYQSPAYLTVYHSDMQFNRRLIATTSSRSGEAGQVLMLIDPAKQSMASLPVRAVPQLDKWGSGLPLTTGQWFDPALEMVTQRPDRPIHVGNATLSVTLAGGTLATVPRRIPQGATGPLLLVDDTGKRRPLAKSEAFTKVTDDAMAFLCGQEGNLVSCNRRDDKSGPLVALWDASGKQVLEVPGFSVEVSADGKRAVVDNLFFGYNRLVELPSGRDLRTVNEPQTNARFDDTRSLIAWDTLGMVDSATNKVLWEADRFGSWIQGKSLIAVVRVYSGSRRYEGGGGFGPFDVREARTGKVVHAFEVDAAIAAQSEDGKVILTQDAVDGWHVRETSQWTQLVEVGTRRVAHLSRDGAFVWSQTAGAIEGIRIADGKRLFQVPMLGKRGLSFDAEDRYDGGPEALELLRYRVGSIRTGRLVKAEEVRGPTPGLAKDFFASLGQP